MSVASVRYQDFSALSLRANSAPKRWIRGSRPRMTWNRSCGLRRAGLAQRMRARESVVLHAGIDDAAHRRERRQVVFVEICPRGLARQADVGDGDGVAVAVAAGLVGPREIGFKRLEGGADPVLDPFEP